MKFAQTVTSCLCSTGLFLALRHELFSLESGGKKNWKAVRERSERSERKGLQNVHSIISAC